MRCRPTGSSSFRAWGGRGGDSPSGCLLRPCSPCCGSTPFVGRPLSIPSPTPKRSVFPEAAAWPSRHRRGLRPHLCTARAFMSACTRAERRRDRLRPRVPLRPRFPPRRARPTKLSQRRPPHRRARSRPHRLRRPVRGRPRRRTARRRRLMAEAGTEVRAAAPAATGRPVAAPLAGARPAATPGPRHLGPRVTRLHRRPTPVGRRPARTLPGAQAPTRSLSSPWWLLRTALPREPSGSRPAAQGSR